MGGEGGTGTVAQGGLRVSRGKACGVWRSFRIARLSRGRTRATEGVRWSWRGWAAPSWVCVCEYGHCACSGQRGSVHLGLDRQWGRWGHIGTATCSVWFPAVSTRGARGILRGVSSRGGVDLGKSPGLRSSPGSRHPCHTRLACRSLTPMRKGATLACARTRVGQYREYAYYII